MFRVATLTLGDMKRLLPERQGPYGQGDTATPLQRGDCGRVKIMTIRVGERCSPFSKPCGIAAPGAIRIGSPAFGFKDTAQQSGDVEEEILISVLEGCRSDAETSSWV